MALAVCASSGLRVDIPTLCMPTRVHCTSLRPQLSTHLFTATSMCRWAKTRTAVVVHSRLARSKRERSETAVVRCKATRTQESLGF